MTRLIIITARMFLASKNQFQLAILEFGYLAHQIGVLALNRIHNSLCRSNKGQPKLGHVPKCLCELPAMFGQNLPYTFDQIVAKHIPIKNNLKP